MSDTLILPASKTEKRLPCPQLTFVLRGRWWRIYAGVTFKSKRIRIARFYGHRLFAIRLWGQRIVGIQTRRARLYDGSSGETE